MSEAERDLAHKEMLELQKISNKLNKIVVVVGIISVTLGIIRLVRL